MNRFGFFSSAIASVAFAVAGASCGRGGPPSSAQCATAGGPSTAAPLPAGATTFVAFAKDFQGYHSWTSYDVTNDADLAGIHDGSTVIEYINHTPPTGLTAFPVGTIIVKEATGGTIPHELFAMVKQGAGFNANLPGWIWFELVAVNDCTDSVTIGWQGFGPPKGDMYGGDASSGCNTCHLACNNDGVCATPLNLANF